MKRINKIIQAIQCLENYKAAVQEISAQKQLARKPIYKN